MPCMNADGELTDSARRILEAMEHAVLLSDTATRTGLPLFRIRSAARELAQAGLIAESEEKWQVTPAGRSALHKYLIPA